MNLWPFSRKRTRIATGGNVTLQKLSYNYLGSHKYDNEPGAKETGYLAIGGRECILQALTMGASKAVVAYRAARAVKTLEETEAAVQTITGTNKVYHSVDAAGRVRYVGITNNLTRRAAEHLASKGIRITGIPGLSALCRADARAVEQVLIERFGGPNGGQLLNMINSISTKNPAYAASLRRGYQLLHAAKYPGF